MNIEIMPIEPESADDQAFVWEVLYHAIYAPPGAQPPPRDILNLPDIARYANGFGNHVGDMGCIAWVDGERAGAAWVRLVHGYGHVDDDTPELSIALLPTYRGQGIGTALLNGLITHVSATYPRISLSVNEGNPARHLYERAGFSEVRRDGESIVMLWQQTT